MYKETLWPKGWDSTIRKTQLQRRGCSLFTTTSVAPLDVNSSSSLETDNETDTGDVQFVKCRLPSGDFYTGLWLVDRPHGTGKYLWMDGCMYEGEWHTGKTMGKGKFSWPSGATYKGEFSSGFLDGFGTFTGASGDTYKGYYSMNLKHGQGTWIYTNGDCYKGDWRCGLQDGQGKYTWKVGHEYNGGWKGGVMSGKGVLKWANGNWFDGDWEDGLPSGTGEFRWPDGSRYVGVWSKYTSVKQGVFYPSAGNDQINPEDALSIDLEQCRICSGENFQILPSQKTVSFSSGYEAEQKTAMKKPYKVMDAPKLSRKCSVVSSQHGRRERNPSITGNSKNTCTERSFDRICIWGYDGDITCDFVDANSVVSAGRKSATEDGNTNLRLSDADSKFGKSPMARFLPRDYKKQGVTISKGHSNYNLMLNLQLGIRHAVGRPAPAISLDLKSSAFDPKAKVWTKFPPEGSKSTPPHQSCEFKWKDYCPVVFRALRKLFQVDAADYMISICGNDALRELSSPGKSGSFFYLTHDDRYMIKTIKKPEGKALLRMLPAYYKHVRSYENTLVTKFFGLHCVKLTGAIQKKVRFVIMGNLFCSDYIIHRRFDLKGSSHGRITDKSESEIDANTTLKDLDLNYIFRLPKSWFQEFTRQVEKDSEFLEQERIMDYSLLVGLHFRETSAASEPFFSEGSSDTSSEGCHHNSKSDMDHLLSDPDRRASIKLGINMPAQVEQTSRISNSDSQLFAESTGEFYDVILFFGIIDILQEYDFNKKVEHICKAFQYDATSISAVDPRLYAKRFRDFMFKVFKEDT